MGKHSWVKVGIAAFVMAVMPISRDVSAHENSVFVESKEVIPNQTDVTIGVYVSNAIPIIAFVLPFEIREISPGSYPTWPVSRMINPVGRMYVSPLGPNDPNSQPAITVNNFYAVTGTPDCSGPISNTYSVLGQQPDAVSPNGYLFVTLSSDDAGHEDVDLDAATEIPGVNPPSFQLRFDVSGIAGQFEIDTCCVRPNSHLAFVNRNTEIVLPSFTKGIVSIGCFCRCHGDPVCNGQLDIVDVVQTINIAFRGAVVPRDQDCTHSRADVDASGATTVSDVVLMIRVVFDGESIETIFTNPCN